MRDNLVGSFFDRQSENYYKNSRFGMAPFHRLTAKEIESTVFGDVLAIGGIWSHHDDEQLANIRLVVLDVSEGMLEKQVSQRITRKVLGDARKLPFADNSFDCVALPLVLHHLAGESARQARLNVLVALSEAYRVLRPGGRILISEFVVSRLIYAAERIAVPVTRAALKLRGIPLVVMHSEAFYSNAMQETGFREIEVKNIQTPLAKPTDLIQPVIGLPIRFPRIMYPLQPVLICGALAPESAAG